MEGARPATAADIADAARLWQEAVAELDGQRGGALLAGTLHLAEPAAALASMLADADRKVVLGTLEGCPMGIAACRLRRDRRELLGELDLIYVEPAARQVGVAEAMIDVVARWAAERGAVGLDAPALPGNRPAKSFFEDHGFQARLLVMHRRIP